MTRSLQPRRLWLRLAGAGAAVLAVTGPGRLAWAAGATPALSSRDPYDSGVWPDIVRAYLKPAGARLVYDSRIEVTVPPFAEDPMNVPVGVRVDPALGPVERVVVLVDRNPIKKVLEYEPLDALPAIAFRFKLEQASPVRAAVRLKTGRWHVGSAWVDSAGGGCTVSGATRKDGSWSQTLGEVSGRLFDRPPAQSVAAESSAAPSAGARLRLQLMHPMDTGLVNGVPAFYVSRLALQDGQGKPLARMLTFEPVSENPVFSFDFASPPAGGVQVVGVDNNGNRIKGQVK